MSILLSEISKLLARQFFSEPENVPDDECECEAKEVLEIVIKYLEEPCKERTHFPHIISIDNAWTMLLNGDGYRHRYYCHSCISEIKKELGI